MISNCDFRSMHGRAPRYIRSPRRQFMCTLPGIRVYICEGLLCEVFYCGQRYINLIISTWYISGLCESVSESLHGNP